VTLVCTAHGKDEDDAECVACGYVRSVLSAGYAYVGPLHTPGEGRLKVERRDSDGRAKA
jgi:hypothetical protein